MNDITKAIINRCEMCGSDYPSTIKTYKGQNVRIFSDYNHFNVLIFVLEGEVKVGDVSDPRYVIGARNFTLMDSSLLYTTSGEETLVVSYHFNNILSNCTRTFLNRFLGFDEDKVLSDNDSVLPIKEQILGLVTGVMRVLDEQSVCSHYIDIKIEEMLISLTMYYSLEELFGVFHQIASENLDFRSFIMSNYEQVESVEEFAKVANMSKITFVRTFQKAFGISPAMWLREKRCESIISDIVLTQIPFSELSYKYSFSSPAYFTLFCKKRWGKTPNELRKEKLNRVCKM